MPPPPTPADLARAAATAADGKPRARALDALVRLATQQNALADAVAELVATGPAGPRLGLEFVSRLPGKLPPELVPTATMLLKQKSAPTRVRLAAAGTLLDSVPDAPDAVQRVLKLVIGKRKGSKALERLRVVQRYCRGCRTLDRTVAAAEAKHLLQCPKCAEKLPRPALIAHLWKKHKLVWQKGKVRAPQALLEEAMAKAAQDGLAGKGPRALDAALRLTRQYFPEVPPGQVFQALAARGAVHVAHLEPLLDRAKQAGCGLCPLCFAQLPDPVPAMPPTLPIGGGRLAGEGFAVDARDGFMGRKLVASGRDGAARGEFAEPSPGAVASLAAAPVVALAAAAPWLVPGNPVAVSGGLAAMGWATYAAVRSFRKASADGPEAMIDLAWRSLVPTAGRKGPSLRFLARLARTSVGRGDANARYDDVRELVEETAANADRSPLAVQALAALRVLEVSDGAAAGREKIAGLLGVFEPALRGELPWAYAEAAADALLGGSDLTSGEAEWLAARLVGTLFGQKFTARDVACLAKLSPPFRRLLRDPSESHLTLAYAVFQATPARRWAQQTGVGAESVFELASGAPGVVKRVLARQPDALLKAELDAATEQDWGPLLVASSGVSVAGTLVADPDALVRVASNGRELVVGNQRLTATRKPTEKLAKLVKTWMTYRGKVLLPVLDAVARTPPSKALALLAPLAVRCQLCGTASVTRTGERGAKWDDLLAGRF